MAGVPVTSPFINVLFLMVVLCLGGSAGQEMAENTGFGDDRQDQAIAEVLPFLEKVQGSMDLSNSPENHEDLRRFIQSLIPRPSRKRACCDLDIFCLRCRYRK